MAKGMQAIQGKLDPERMSDMSTKNKVRSYTLQGITVVEMSQGFSRDSAQGLVSAYREISDRAENKFIFRVDQETYFNSESIKILLDIMVDARNKGIEVAITGLSDHFEKIFRMVGIDKLAIFYKTIGGALDHLKR
jgi:anti-anti-sigma factor